MLTFHAQQNFRRSFFVPFLCGILIGILLFVSFPSSSSFNGEPVSGTQNSANSYLTVDTLRTREDLPAYLERLGLRRGAELGVQAGHFAKHALSNWPSCEQYILIDVWAHQENYHDVANVNDESQSKLLEETRARLAEWKGKTVFYRNYTSEAVKYIPDESLDFIYVDARHDYCGVKEDIELYWPKLRKGGLMAGHDYLEAGEVGGQDWSLCIDGTRNAGAVKGAVDEFTRIRGLQVVVTYKESWNTWMIRKQLN